MAVRRVGRERARRGVGEPVRATDASEARQGGEGRCTPQMPSSALSRDRCFSARAQSTATHWSRAASSSSPSATVPTPT